MTTVELPEGVEHGTPAGHEAGCKGELHCPALRTHGMTCTHAYVRSTTTPDRYFKAKNRDPRPEAIARTLGFKPTRPHEPLDVVQEDEKFAERSAEMRERAKRRESAKPPTSDEAATPTVDQPTNAVLDEHSGDAGPLDEAAAQLLAEQSNDPSGSDEAPVVDEPAAVLAPGEGVAEGEGMGHPTPTAEKPAPTADDEKRRRAEIRAWAAEHGVTVSTAGRIPRAIVVAWLNDDPSALPRKTGTTRGFEVFQKPKTSATLTTDRFTAGLTTRAKSDKLREIREWARANGFPGVPTHGKIPNDALAAFAAAHSTSTPDAEPVVDDKTRGGGEPAAVGPPASEQESPGGTVPTVPTEPGLENPEYLRDIVDMAERSEQLDEVRERIAEPTPRPEWGEVAASADVERARGIAARLFLELTDAEAARDQAHAALEVTLQKWDDMSARAMMLELRLSVVKAMVPFHRDAVRLAENRALELADKLGEATERAKGWQDTAEVVAAQAEDYRQRAIAAEVERDRLRALVEYSAVATPRQRRWLRRASS